MRLLLSAGYTEAQFHEARSKRLGSSDIAAVAGLNKWRSPLQVWLEKTGRDTPKEENDSMWLGKQWEPIIAELFTRRTGFQTYKVGEIWQHKTHDWAIATPDYWVRSTFNSKIMEIKKPNWRSRDEWAEDKAPEYATLQLQWQLEVGEIDAGYCVGLIGGDPKDFYYPEQTRNKEIGEQLLEVGYKFMELVRKDTPPGAIAGDSHIIEKLFPEHYPSEIILPNETEMDFQRYSELKGMIKRSDDEISAISARLQMAIGGNTAGKIGAHRCGWKSFKRSAYQVSAVDKMIFQVKPAKE